VLRVTKLKKPRRATPPATQKPVPQPASKKTPRHRAPAPSPSTDAESGSIFSSLFSQSLKRAAATPSSTFSTEIPATKKQTKIPAPAIAAEITAPVEKNQKYNFKGAEFLDHFETPITAYQDIQPALAEVAKAMGIEQHQLRIYDPYFCQGSIKRHLGKLGFPLVYNENEDFYSSNRYQQPRGASAKEYDVVVTNPPYSGDHKERCIRWLRATGKPWFNLMWAFAADKGWYTSGEASEGEWFIAPTEKSKYDFRNPSGKGMQGGSPYQPLWFCSTMGLDNGTANPTAQSRGKGQEHGKGYKGKGKGKGASEMVSRVRAEVEKQSHGTSCVHESIAALKGRGVVRAGKRPSSKQRAKMRAKRR
jgi:hypothetical protein